MAANFNSVRSGNCVSLLIRSVSITSSRCCLFLLLIRCCVWTEVTNVLITIITEPSVFAVWSREVPEILVCEVCASASGMWVSLGCGFCVAGV